MRSQVISLDSAQSVKVLKAFNDLKYYKSLDSISSAKIDNLETITQNLETSLETCANQRETLNSIIELKDQDLEATKNALQKESRRVRLFKGSTILAAIIGAFLVLVK